MGNYQRVKPCSPHHKSVSLKVISFDNLGGIFLGNRTMYICVLCSHDILRSFPQSAGHLDILHPEDRKRDFQESCAECVSLVVL